MAKRGRPASEPTADERKKVKELAADKAPLADIAKLMARSIPTLRKYFAKELFSGKKMPAAADIKVTAPMRAKVERYIGCKMAPDQVAKVLGITVEQLEANFPDEIATGAAKCRAKVIDALHDQMGEGVAAAAKLLEAMTAGPEGAPSAPSLGKKAAADAAAAAAASGGSKFAPPPGPKLVVNNGK